MKWQAFVYSWLSPEFQTVPSMDSPALDENGAYCGGNPLSRALNPKPLRQLR